MSRKEKKAAEKAEEAVEQQESMRVDLYEWIQSLMTALVICMAIFIFIIRVIDVSGSSMFPTLHDGDKMLVSNLFYTPHAGDVVVFKTDRYDPERALVKRVIATEGQEISIDFDRGIVYIDGLPVEEDYIAELTKPGRDPRDELPPPLLRTDVLDIKDLKPGMVLKGTVRNVIDFGAFIDIGVHQDGLVHISQISDKRIRHPSDVLSVGDIVTVSILSVDTAKNRISLTIKGVPKEQA